MYYADLLSRFEDYLLRLIWGQGFERTFVEESRVKGDAPQAEIRNPEHFENSPDRFAPNGLEKKSQAE